MEMFGRELGVRGYHIYQQLWEAAIGEELECQHERGKAADAYAIAISVIREGTVIGYLLKKISCVCTLFIRRGGAILCRVTGSVNFNNCIQNNLHWTVVGPSKSNLPIHSQTYPRYFQYGECVTQQLG